MQLIKPNKIFKHKQVQSPTVIFYITYPTIAEPLQLRHPHYCYIPTIATSPPFFYSFKIFLLAKRFLIIQK